MKKLKKNNAITLVSLIIYMVVLFVVISMLMRLSNRFNNSIDEVADILFEEQFDKFNLYFLNEVKITGNNISNIDETNIEFTSGNKYSYDEENKTIYLNDDIIISTYIDNCKFETYDYYGKIIIKVTITIGENTVVKEYVL